MVMAKTEIGNGILRIIAAMTQYIVFIAEVQAAQAARLRVALTDASNAGDDIYLLISSAGGNVSEGLNIAAFMKTLPVQITTHNIGQTDSIANVIFAAGSKRYANQNASFLFHGVSMHYERMDFIESQLEEQHKIVKRLRENIAAVFAHYTGISVADTESLMVSGATILNSQEALVKLIIHEIRDAAIAPNSKVVSIGNA
jgi:ATP-dependent protease ClpP protease subunit